MVKAHAVLANCPNRTGNNVSALSETENLHRSGSTLQSSEKNRAMGAARDTHQQTNSGKMQTSTRLLVGKISAENLQTATF